ncbi:NfeD family protein [Photobacterium angustum]|uniref:NfeD family protein n=1 Tax=Photobacterium angustum TaxID=661 RepID=UPI0005E6FEB8|nr:nodulation protein NfeD [Photobacterium angustum]KJG24950.1 serine protease [Photobacterium angustum]KJG32921.1 serine protease [Photobacterium angustum]PSW97539.1 nodulation protein NfeD [Photobacterium angustum]PSX00644.1 nodulation protein NfeD [Photobacterium angustum]PSX36713.1 nodulation protein NfeD [Photobacterium angustum]
MKTFIQYLLLSLIIFCSPVLAQDVWVINLKGGIGPATSDYVTREISEAQKNNAAMIILQVDTPGGLDSSMRQIIQAITVSPVPVATWVGPSGSRAASAGTYILLASHIASMANGTNLGAATPVSIGGGNAGESPFNGEKSEDKSKSEDEVKSSEGSEQTSKEPAAIKSGSAMENKVMNDAAAYIESLAKLHNRNAEWAVKAVTESASISAETALQKNVIDFIAQDVAKVVEKSNGRMVKLNGVETPIELSNVRFIEREQDWRFKLLSVLTNPNVAYILMLIGMYGLLLEFYNPGVGLPGVLGGICFVLAMYSLQMLPISYAGLALIILGVMLMVAEAFSPSFGILGLGGIVSFALGSVMLMDTDLPGYQIAVPLIIGFTAVSAAFFFIILTMLVKSRKKPVTTGVTTLIGQQATVMYVDNEAGKYRVLVEGEIWQATSTGVFHKGDTVIVTAIRGLWLEIDP